jgi:hypothetical protein
MPISNVTEARTTLIELGSSDIGLQAMRRLYAYQSAEAVRDYSMSEMVSFLLDGSLPISHMSAEDLADQLTIDLMHEEQEGDAEGALEQAQEVVQAFTEHAEEYARRVK